jgi:hypothetical protein
LIIRSERPWSLGNHLHPYLHNILSEPPCLSRLRQSPIRKSPRMSSKRDICLRLLVLASSVCWLTIAALNSTNAHFSTVLRDRAQTDDWRFFELQKKVLIRTVPTIVIAVGISISGSVVSLQPRTDIRTESLRYFYLVPSIFSDIVVMALGFSLSYQVSGFRNLFEMFGGSDHIPYYDLMHLGGIWQPDFGFSMSSVLLSTLSWTASNFARPTVARLNWILAGCPHLYGD